jgi:hypothetical protein
MHDKLVETGKEDRRLSWNFITIPLSIFLSKTEVPVRDLAHFAEHKDML